MLKAHGRFQEQCVELGGKIINSNALQPTTTATSVRGDVVTDGPFAETKEQVGGFCLIEAADLDEAVAVAAEHPAATYGTIEVRELWPPL